MSETGSSFRQRHGALGLAAASVLVYFLALSLLNNRPIADEGYHLRAIEWYRAGHWAAPGMLPMLPGYHMLAGLLVRLGGPPLLLMRVAGTLLALGTVGLARGIVRAREQAHPSDALLHVAWNPLLFAYMPLVYTDLPAMFCLLAAVYLFCRGRYALCGLGLLLSCLVRQSGVVWAGLLPAWGALDLWRDRGGASPPARAGGRLGRMAPLLGPLARRAWPGLAVVALMVAFFAARGRLTMGVERANRPAFNVAQLYSFGLFVALLWAPLWVELLWREWGSFFGPLLMRASGCALLSGAVALLVLCFDNPHPWNRGLDYLKNWPLVYMSGSLAWRSAGALVIVAALGGALRFAWRQPRRDLLALSALLSVVFLLPQPLAEPRYYIAPVFFFNLFARYTRRQARRLTVWYGIICALVATRVCLWPGATGGVW